MIFSTDSRKLMQAGYDSLKAERYTKAVTIGKQLIARGHSSGYEILALAYSALDEDERVISTLQDGVDAFPSVWLLWHLLGNKCSDEERFREAQQSYAVALDCPKVDANLVHFNSALAYFRERRYDEAIAQLEYVTAERFQERAAQLLNEVTQAREVAEFPLVWLFLVEVRALEGGDMYSPGSTAFVQCCVPGQTIEGALPALDTFLSSHRYKRIDLQKACRYDLSDPEYPPPETAQEAMITAAKNNQPEFALFIHASDSATLLGEET